MRSSPVYKLEEDGHDYESGYASGSSSDAELPEIYFTKPHLAFLNRQLQNLEPQGTDIAIRLCKAKLTQDSRNITVVHNLVTWLIPGDCVWPYRPDKSRHALEDENSKAANGRPTLLRHPPPLR